VDITDERQVGLGLGSIEKTQDEFRHLSRQTRNPTVEVFGLRSEGYDVPYVKAVRYPVDENGKQVYPHEGDPEPHHHAVDLILDDRFGYVYDSLEEVEEIVPLLANAMAIAAGYTAHGHAVRRNPHGPCEASLEPLQTESIPRKQMGTLMEEES
jgi:hypothetical protein